MPVAPGLAWLTDMRITKILLALIIASCATCAWYAWADPVQRNSQRDVIRAYHLQYVMPERNGQPQEVQGERQAERRVSGDYGFPESSGDGSQGDGMSEFNRKQARMSPEERRALRRQINEVGQDIYRPKR